MSGIQRTSRDVIAHIMESIRADMWIQHEILHNPDAPPLARAAVVIREALGELAYRLAETRQS